MVEKTKLFSVQRIEAWEQAKSNGFLRFQNWDQICDDSFKPAYEWMIQQLEKSVGHAYERSALPIWAWVLRKGKKTQNKFDLERGGHLSEDTKGVYLEFEVEVEKILQSEFIAWHQVLYEGYLPKNDEDFDDFEAWLAEEDLDYNVNFKKYPKVWEKVTHSWENIFQLETSMEYHDSESIQACLWEIPVKNVSRVIEFTAKRPGTFLERRLEDWDWLCEKVLD